MSRTDHHAPGWVRATWWRPEHYRCQHSWSPRRACDLPAWPERRQHRALGCPCGVHHCGIHTCHWEPETVSTIRRSSRWVLRHSFRRPERMAVRDACRQARAEHRAGGEVTAEPPTVQHRHQALWIVG